MSLPVGIQLWSVKDETAKDFVGTLEKIAQMGYDGVEFAGYGGLTEAQMADTLKKLGLKVAGSHIGLDKLRNNLDYEIAFNKAVGNTNLVCPWSKPESKNAYDELAAELNKIGEAAVKQGMTLSYHNHGHELADIGGIRGLDYLWQQTDPELVKAELDLYWVKFGGADPLEYMKSVGSRTILLHYKDMDNEQHPHSTEVGGGIIDFTPITAYAKTIGTQWLIVEQEYFTKPCLESVEISINNIKRLGLS